jgi:hypothetical protein
LLVENSVALNHRFHPVASKALAPVCVLFCSLSDVFILYIKGGAGFDAGFAGGAGAGFGEAAGGGFGSSSFESSSSSFSSGGGGGASFGAGGFDVAGAAFNSADTNRDGRLDAGEFSKFVQGGL